MGGVSYDGGKQILVSLAASTINRGCTREDRALWHIFIAANEDQQLGGTSGHLSFFLVTRTQNWFLGHVLHDMITPRRRENTKIQLN